MIVFNGNLPVNWPKLLRPFQNDFDITFSFLDVYVFRKSFYIISNTKKWCKILSFLNCILDQFNAVESM